MFLETQNICVSKSLGILVISTLLSRIVILSPAIMVKNVVQPDNWVARHFYKILFSMKRVHFTTLMEDDEPSSKLITTIFTPWKGLSLWAPMML